MLSQDSHNWFPVYNFRFTFSTSNYFVVLAAILSIQISNIQLFHSVSANAFGFCNFYTAWNILTFIGFIEMNEDFIFSSSNFTL